MLALINLDGLGKISVVPVRRNSFEVIFKLANFKMKRNLSMELVEVCWMKSSGVWIQRGTFYGHITMLQLR
jgi:hypothetical protein